MRFLRPSRLAVAGLVAGALCVGALAACSSRDASDSGSAPLLGTEAAPAASAGTVQRDAAGRGENAAKTNADQANGGTAPKDMSATTPVRLAEAERSIIYTGSITIKVKNVDAAAAQATAFTTGAGGFVGGDQRSSDNGRQQATLTLRVPSARFTTVVSDLRGLGHEEGRTVRTEDVTEQVADLESRVATARASVARVRELLARAQTIGDIVSLESELSRRESDLESLQARLRKLGDLAALSTITVVLRGPEPARPRDRADTSDDTGFVAGFKSGWRAFAASIGVLLTVLGALVPWLLALAVPTLAVLWTIRLANRRRARGEPATPAANETPGDGLTPTAASETSQDEDPAVAAPPVLP